MRIVTGHNPDWDKAFHDMVRGVVYQHLMWTLKPVLDPLYDTLDKIEQDVFEIETLLRRPGRAGDHRDAAALQTVDRTEDRRSKRGELPVATHGAPPATFQLAGSGAMIVPATAGGSAVTRSSAELPRNSSGAA